MLVNWLIGVSLLKLLFLPTACLACKAVSVGQATVEPSSCRQFMTARSSAQPTVKRAVPRTERAFYPTLMTSPDSDRLRYGRIAGIAAKHANIWGLGGPAKAAAIAELAEAADGRDAAHVRLGAIPTTACLSSRSRNWPGTARRQPRRRSTGTRSGRRPERR